MTNRAALDRAEIEKLIPHRPPFLWIDRVEAVEPGLRCVAWLSVAAENPIFAGHFPTQPILPGVLMIEAVAQTAAVMMGASTSADTLERALLAAVHRFKFLQPVAPGAHLRIETALLTQAGSMACVEGIITWQGEKVASGELTILSQGTAFFQRKGPL